MRRGADRVVDLGNGRIAYVNYIDSLGGMTEDNEDGHTSTVFAPRPTSGYNRTVLRHELLHAKYDSAIGRAGGAGYNAKRRAAIDAMPDSKWLGPSISAVDDAFVQLVYWPKGEDRVADHEAVTAALWELTVGGGHHEDNVNNRGVVLRALAILRKLGTHTDQAVGRLAARVMLDARTVANLEGVLDLVEADDRLSAYKAMVSVSRGVREFADSAYSIEHDIARAMGRHNRMSLWALA